MKALPNAASDQDILDAVREWVALLVEERYADAYHFLRHNPMSATNWNPELIEAVIHNYGSPEPRRDGRTFLVTPIAEATGERSPIHDVQRYAAAEVSDGYLGYVWFDLPLNGEWSDLTATFDFMCINDSIVLQLSNIHVM